MPGFFSSLFDLQRRLSFFGRDVHLEPGHRSLGDAIAAPAPVPQSFFALTPDDFLLPSEFVNGSSGTGLPPSLGGTPPAPRPAGVVPAGANLADRGHPQSDWTNPRDYPWRVYPDVDPRMPFFVLPPNAIFNMPIIKNLPGTPYVGKDGLPHLEGWNPYEGRVVSPGRGI